MSTTEFPTSKDDQAAIDKCSVFQAKEPDELEAEYRRMLALLEACEGYSWSVTFQEELNRELPLVQKIYSELKGAQCTN
jgi:hypothetical protein